MAKDEKKTTEETTEAQETAPVGKKNPFVGLMRELGELPATVKDILGHGALHRRKKLKTLRRQLSTEGFDVSEIDEELDVLKGSKKVVGLLHVLGVDDDDGKKKGAKEPDPLQRDVEEELGPRDFRTHELTTDGVRELVSRIAADEKPVAAVRILNGLEDGEREREAGPRESVLKVIRSARRPLVEKVEKFQLSNGGAS